VLRRLAGLRGGCITLGDSSGESVLGDPAAPLRAAVAVRDPSFWPAVALRGSVGAGEAYMDGAWTADDLVALVRILVRDREVLDGMEGGLARLGGAALRAWHALRPNTRSGSRRNVADHYDLGNDLFALFLDPTMTYSCGVFEREDATLEEASVAKVDRLCRMLDLRPDHRLLEIGTGWGFLAVRAAGRHGCRVTTLTLSREQRAAALERVARAGLGDRVEVRLQDWRDAEGAHDRLVSVEMIEAVGHERTPEFLRACARLLRPGGAMALQSIVIDDRRYEAARDSVDFIKRWVFPGSCIPSRGSLAAAARGAGLRVARVEEIGPHYAQTLREWRERFLARRAEVRALGYPERFVRLWEFYLAYCEGGFEEGVLGDVQMLLEKPPA
jgi:cyclopropane-fatty-acyl-phospholipid synthase